MRPDKTSSMTTINIQKLSWRHLSTPFYMKQSIRDSRVVQLRHDLETIY